MKYIDAFRNPDAAAALRGQINELAAELATAGIQARIMEVCGTHTMAIGRYGIRDILPDNIDLVSGPGCPVCVTGPGYIDTAIALAQRDGIIVTFGDMLNVPGSSESLAECRAAGGTVRVCYSPLAALDIAAENPGRPVIFLAIGFETTICPVASIVGMAERRGVDNLFLLTAFKLVPPALHALLADADIRIDAFLCPAHVSAIIGARAYEPFAREKRIPCVIAGFEPLDILLGIRGILAQLVKHEAVVENQYSRVVKPDGNLKARAVMQRYLRLDDASWRGLGVIAESGMRLRDEYARYDAEARLGVTVGAGEIHPGCCCGDVVKGKIKPAGCPMFASACTPDRALGPCMVSSEGTCAAYYKFSRMEDQTNDEGGQ